MIRCCRSACRGCCRRQVGKKIKGSSSISIHPPDKYLNKMSPLLRWLFFHTTSALKKLRNCDCFFPHKFNQRNIGSIHISSKFYQFTTILTLSAWILNINVVRLEYVFGHTEGKKRWANVIKIFFLNKLLNPNSSESLFDDIFVMIRWIWYTIIYLWFDLQMCQLSMRKIILNYGLSITDHSKFNNRSLESRSKLITCPDLCINLHR